MIVNEVTKHKRNGDAIPRKEMWKMLAFEVFNIFRGGQTNNIK
jgi:hypothetical protein